MNNKDALFATYAAYHRDPRNRLCHEIGIPLIVLAIEAFARLVAIGPYSLAALLTAAVILYYFFLAKRDALLAIALLAVLYFISAYVPWPYAVGLFVIGWALQFIGHAYEGKSPAFLTNAVHLLVGPLWVTTLLVPKRTS
jgi:uncharacterized membrane protein YGL010W